MTSVNLSPRLQALAEMVDSGEILMDVGTDHGYLPCYLVKEGVCSYAYAADLRLQPLARAKETIAYYGLNNRVIPLLRNGLTDAPEDINAVSIAGMGPETALSILKAGDLSRLNHVYIQVNSRMDKIRAYLNDKHFPITDEKIVEEHGHFYELLCFVPRFEASRMSDDDIKLGPINRIKKDEVTLKYFRHRLNKAELLKKKSAKTNFDEEIRLLRCELGIE